MKLISCFLSMDVKATPQRHINPAESPQSCLSGHAAPPTDEHPIFYRKGSFRLSLAGSSLFLSATSCRRYRQITCAYNPATDRMGSKQYENHYRAQKKQPLKFLTIWNLYFDLRSDSSGFCDDCEMSQPMPQRKLRRKGFRL